MSVKIAFKRDKMNKKYSAIVRGENFLLDYEGETKMYGFVTTRNIKASSVDEAKELAIKLVENDEDLQNLMSEEQSKLHLPTLFVEEMYELSWWKRLGGKGFTFFVQAEELKEH